MTDTLDTSSSAHCQTSAISSPSELPSRQENVAADDFEHNISCVLDQLEQLCRQLRAAYSLDGPTDQIDDSANIRLSVVVPVFNEKATLCPLLARLRVLPLNMEIILIDDCSTDGSREVLKQLENTPEFSVIYHDTNKGKGAALRAGFAKATGDIIMVQDADLEYDPRDIPTLLKPIVENNADVVYGSRFLDIGSCDTCAAHRYGNRILTAASNLITGLRLTDMETCYKVFRRTVIQSIPLKQNRFGFEPEITAKLARRGYQVEELPVRYKARNWADGKKIGVRDGVNALLCILRYAIAD